MRVGAGCAFLPCSFRRFLYFRTGKRITVSWRMRRYLRWVQVMRRFLSHTHGGELCIISSYLICEEHMGTALLGASSTEMMQDFPLHVSESPALFAAAAKFFEDFRIHISNFRPIQFTKSIHPSPL